ILALLLIIIIYIYNKFNREVEYYNYSFDYENLKIIKPLNIAMFTNNYLPFVGGVPTSIYRLSKGLSRMGLKPIIFAPSFNDCRSYKIYYKDDIEEIRFKYLFKYKKFSNIPITNILNPNISKIFEEKNIDIVHVHHPFWMGRKGMRLSKIYRCPLVLTYHTRLEKYSHYVPIGKKIFKNVLSHYIIKNFAKKCDLVIAPTTNARDYLKNIGVRCNIEILPTGVDFDLYKSVAKSDLTKLEKKYKEKPNEVILITVSRLSKEKNLYFIIDGIKILKNLTDIPFKLLIIGKGDEKEALESYIKKLELDEVVILVGEVLPENIAKYYIFSDIFVFASTTETQGLVLLEAMAGGCPVVAVQSSGIDDIINNDYNGYKTPENIYSWAEKIKTIIENNEKYNELSNNALKHVNRYSIELIAEKVAKLYTRLLLDKK
ncbi:MAG: glycosyltransferase, partial [Deferribacterota bacterium]|nr:glycosyltransferase [Deferribacterota bacterium]